MLTARRRARIEAATEAHIAAFDLVRPVPFEQPQPPSSVAVERQESAWLTYWRNLVFTGSLR